MKFYIKINITSALLKFRYNHILKCLSHWTFLMFFLYVFEHRKKPTHRVIMTQSNYYVH